MMLLYRFIFISMMDTEIIAIKCQLQSIKTDFTECPFPWPNLRKILLGDKAIPCILGMETIICFFEGLLEDKYVFNIVTSSWLKSEILDRVMTAVMNLLSVGNQDEFELSLHEFLNVSIERIKS